MYKFKSVSYHHTCLDSHISLLGRQMGLLAENSVNSQEEQILTPPHIIVASTDDQIKLRFDTTVLE
jgi:hypothetical protein